MSAYTRLDNWYRRLGPFYETTQPILWELGYRGSEEYIVVPPRTEFDVSVPPLLTWLFDPHDRRYLKAACLHDELLRRGWNRVTAGAVFHQALLADGTPAWRRLPMWLAVSLRRYQ